MPIKLWLDDVRDPAEYGLAGWTWVKTVDEAKALLKTGDVLVASLDHDLGACDECMGGMSAVDWLVTHGYASMPHCSHFGTGYDLVCWMEETGTWTMCARHGIDIPSDDIDGADIHHSADGREADEPDALPPATRH